MPNLAKAKIYEITNGQTPRLVEPATDVQFNPESLSRTQSNRTEGGRSSGRQVRQFVGSNSSTYSLDLEFDSADDGTTQKPISVLEKTSFLDKFIQPKTEGNNSTEQPAKIRFHWGDLIIDGIVESINLELDHFADNGFSLHAKVTLEIKEQKIELQYVERGGDESVAGAQDQQQVAQALDDEMPSQAASRLGLDPSNWRDLGFDPGLDLSLEAGLELSFQAGISATLGVDIKAGVDADINLELAAKLGLEAGANISLSHLPKSSAPKQQVSSSLALAKAGGITAATNQLENDRATQASSSSVSAFGLDARVAKHSGAGQAGAPTSVSGSTASGSSLSNPAPSSPTQARTTPLSLTMSPDTRATTFGYSVPLQNRRVPILDQQGALRASTATIADFSNTCLGRKAADSAQHLRRPVKRCGCQSLCNH